MAIAAGTQVIGTWHGEKYPGTYVGPRESVHHGDFGHDILRHDGYTNSRGVWFVDSVELEADYRGGCGGSGEVIYKSTNKKPMSSLKEKFALVFKSEPERSFIKAGILDSREVLTSEGTEVLLAWLLKKNGAEFKTEVVDPILADDKKD